MKLTKQIKEDMEFMQNAMGLLHRHWGEEADNKIKELISKINTELQSLTKSTDNDVRKYIIKYLKELGWDDNKIEKWFNGESNPFRINKVDISNMSSKLMIGELFLMKLFGALQLGGIPDKDSLDIATAVFIAGRPQYKKLRA